MLPEQACSVVRSLENCAVLERTDIAYQELFCSCSLFAYAVNHGVLWHCILTYPKEVVECYKDKATNMLEPRIRGVNACSETGFGY